MHAALDAVGRGMPCAVSARFDGLTPDALEQHLLATAARFPILRSRLAWSGDRPILQPGTGSPIARAAPLDFSATDALLSWQAAIRASQGGSVLTAVFSHTMADGGSMLRLIAEIERRLTGTEPPVQTHLPARPPRPPAIPWLAGFLAERARAHLVLAPDAVAPVGASWFRVGPGDRDRVIALARSTCGRVLPFLSAATALAAGEMSAGRRRRISLYIPLARSHCEAFHGFGFGVGSLLLGQDLAPSMDMETLARQLAPRLSRQAAQGWDAGLEWFLGSAPRRHRKFAELRLRARPDPAINVSWKGFYRGLGGPHGALDLACFGAAPTGHVSAHADLGGLSISFTAPRSRPLRESFLERIARRLGIEGALAFKTYDDPNCSAARSA